MRGRYFQPWRKSLGEPMQKQNINSFEAFWPYYLREHSKPATRLMHYVGTALLLPIALAGFTLNLWLLIALPFCGYGFAWVAHFAVEKNRPATFTYPAWSLASDFRMFGLMLTGKLGEHLKLADVPAQSSPAESD